MDRRADYSKLIKRSVDDWASYICRAQHNCVEIQRVFDDHSQNHALIYLGWENNRRVQKTALHLRIKDGKIWVEADETDEGFANVLLKAGVPRHDIVLAFHPPELRRFSEFASA
jgi:XisI protein